MSPEGGLLPGRVPQPLPEAEALRAPLRVHREEHVAQEAHGLQVQTGLRRQGQRTVRAYS